MDIGHNYVNVLGQNKGCNKLQYEIITILETMLGDVAFFLLDKGKIQSNFLTQWYYQGY